MALEAFVVQERVRQREVGGSRRSVSTALIFLWLVSLDLRVVLSMIMARVLHGLIVRNGLGGALPWERVKLRWV